VKKKNKIFLKYFFIWSSVVVYLAACLLLTLEQNLARYQSYDEAIKSLKNNSETIILDKFEINSSEYLSALKDQSVVADTLVYGLYSNDKGSYLIASVLNEKDQRILLKLSVDSDVLHNYSRIQYKRVILTAKINRVLKLPYQKEIYSFDNELIWENINYDIMLEGNLDELLYISPLQS